MIYLASPYTHRDPEVVKEWFVETERALASMMEQGDLVWSPIVLCHKVAENYNLPTDYEYWEKQSIDFIRRCDEVRVLTLEGWRESRGVQAEIRLAINLNILVTYWEPTFSGVRQIYVIED